MSMEFRAILVALFCVHHSMAGPSFPGPAQYFGHAALHAAVLCADVAPRAQASRGHAVLGPDSKRLAASPTSLPEIINPDDFECDCWEPYHDKVYQKTNVSIASLSKELKPSATMTAGVIRTDSLSTAVSVTCPKKHLYGKAMLIIGKNLEDYPTSDDVFIIRLTRWTNYFLLPLSKGRETQLCLPDLDSRGRARKDWLGREKPPKLNRIRNSVYPLMHGTLDEWQKNATPKKFERCFEGIAEGLARGLHKLHQKYFHGAVARENLLYREQSKQECPLKRISLPHSPLYPIKTLAPFPRKERKLWEYPAIMEWRTLFTILCSMLKKSNDKTFNDTEFGFKEAADDFHTTNSTNSTVVNYLAKVLEQDDWGVSGIDFEKKMADALKQDFKNMEHYDVDKAERA